MINLNKPRIKVNNNFPSLSTIKSKYLVRSDAEIGGEKR